jgi:bifunctional DNA-binding transcriptional regulator/antitoxin component of YhaV-PrlF toxin-antitoxin module
MKTTLVVDDDGVLTFPDEMIEKLGWKEGDVLEWIDLEDGSFTLKKKDET